MAGILLLCSTVPSSSNHYICTTPYYKLYQRYSYQLRNPHGELHKNIYQQHPHSRWCPGSHKYCPRHAFRCLWCLLRHKGEYIDTHVFLYPELIYSKTGDTLASVARLVGVNASILATWNPEISSGSLPAVGSAICIIFPKGNYTLLSTSRPSNAYTGAIQKCAQYYTVQSGDGCPSIENRFGLTNSQFDELNPGLASDCTNLILGLAYCVLPTVPFSASNTTTTGPPSNVAPGTLTKGCLSYYTVVSGDSCFGIESKFSITFTNFTTWNPEINTACTNLQLGLAYCISFKPTSP